MLCVLLALITLIIYWDIQSFEFLNYDDNEFIIENQHIRDGFSLDSIVYAFTDINSGIWHPITWLSHILDCQIFGLNPMGHHWNNIIFHLINTLLVFLILQRMTGALYRSCFVAVLFAIHPLQIESVAWIAERKNVLSTFFYLLSILSYIHYINNQKIGRYLTVILLFILGLMSKPMMVTMPFVLLLLDYWPLDRFGACQENINGYSRKDNNKRLILEKVSFLIIAVIFSIISWQSQYLSGAMTDLKSIPLFARIELSLISYVKYLYKLIWPTDLAFFYPYSGDVPLWQVLGASLILIFISIYSICCYKRKKYVLFGWLWFLGTIFPVIGLVHLGDQAMADRYMYIPCIGIFVIIVWEGHSLITNLANPKILSVTVCSAIIIVLSLVSIDQLKTWKNNYSLYSHAIKVTNGNYVAHGNLGAVLLNSGRADEAIYHLEKALEIKPQHRKSHFDMGTALAAQKDFDGAKKHYHWVLERYPNDLETIYMLGRVCFDMGEYEKSMNYLSTYLKQNPNHIGALKYSGHISMKLENYQEAKRYYISAIEQKPDVPKVLNNLGVIFYNEGDLNKAGYYFKLALKNKPDFKDAHLNLRNVQMKFRSK